MAVLSITDLLTNPGTVIGGHLAVYSTVLVAHIRTDDRDAYINGYIVSRAESPAMAMEMASDAYRQQIIAGMGTEPVAVVIAGCFVGEIMSVDEAGELLTDPADYDITGVDEDGEDIG